MLNKYAFVDAAFIVGIAIIFVVLNEFNKIDLVKNYAVVILYASYLIGRQSAKLGRKDTSTQDSTNEVTNSNYAIPE